MDDRAGVGEEVFQNVTLNFKMTGLDVWTNENMDVFCVTSLFLHFLYYVARNVAHNTAPTGVGNTAYAGDVIVKKHWQAIADGN